MNFLYIVLNGISNPLKMFKDGGKICKEKRKVSDGEGAVREAGVVIIALTETYRQEFGFTSS